MKSRRGFSLIETVIGLAVIGIAFYLLASVFINLAPRTARVETIDKKTYLASGKLEEFLTRSFSQTSNQAAAAFPAPFSNYNYQVVVTYVATGDLNTAVAGPTPFKNVKVRVWGGPLDQASTVEITSLVVSYEVQ
jgi:prepilin-type N-terminal cleavage/methylation domain-containing protein